MALLCSVPFSHSLPTTRPCLLCNWKTVLQVMWRSQLPSKHPSPPLSCLQVKMSRKQIAQLIGRVFIQKSAVNLLSTVLDTPEFFWSAPDALQARQHLQTLLWICLSGWCRLTECFAPGPSLLSRKLLYLQRGPPI